MRRFSVSVLARAMLVARHRLAAVAAVSALALLALADCSSGGSTSSTKAPAASPSSPASQTYTSKAFVVPLTVTVGASLKSPPNPDSAHLLSWDAASSPVNKVRFLVPVNLYRPGSLSAVASPKHYLTYLQGLTSQGVKLSNMTKMTVDGHPATLMSMTSPITFGALLGCPSKGVDPQVSCFGIQRDVSLRIAVIPVGNSTLLAWASMNKANPDGGFSAMFEKMLNTVKFR